MEKGLQTYMHKQQSKKVVKEGSVYSNTFTPFLFLFFVIQVNLSLCIKKEEWTGSAVMEQFHLAVNVL